MSDEEKKALEYLEKYTRWETYGERNLEVDIETVVNLVRRLLEEKKGDKNV